MNHLIHTSIQHFSTILRFLRYFYGSSVGADKLHHILERVSIYKDPQPAIAAAADAAKKATKLERTDPSNMHQQKVADATAARITADRAEAYAKRQADQATAAVTEARAALHSIFIISSLKTSDGNSLFLK